MGTTGNGAAIPRGRAEAPWVVRTVAGADAETWLDLRDALWPGSYLDHQIEIEVYLADPPRDAVCLVAEQDGLGVVGFAELALRAYAENCVSSPVGYLEGIYVAPAHRGSGVGRALVRAGEEWARGVGCTELASDRDLGNEASGAFHERLAFEETTRIVCYRKSLTAHGGVP